MKTEALKNEIEIELKNLKRLAVEMDELIIGCKDEDMDSVKTRAAGSILHDFYCGVEKIFERIAIYIDGHLPKGEDWHTSLLDRMESRSVISEKLKNKLKEYLRFRHLFRNIYGFALRWELFKNLGLDLKNILKSLKKDLNSFI